MKNTFSLKESKSDKPTLIFFRCYFKEEGTRFLYSTGETIHPKQWDALNKFPFLNGANKHPDVKSIQMQLNRYSGLFLELESQYKRMGEPFTSEILKKEFDAFFKKSASGRKTFFDCYDDFMIEKQELKEWSTATIKRYYNIKNILLNFQSSKKYPLSFTTINDTFHRKFTSYCMDDLGHINNTYARNLGLFKTFMFWAIKRKHTYNDAFIGFKKVERVITNQIALTLEDLNLILKFDFESDRLERVRDVFVFACVTGMRFGELSLIRRSNVTNEAILLKEDKDETKVAREVPLTAISRYILSKYNYRLPLIANQKQNQYIKECFKMMQYDNVVQKVTTKGKENIKLDLKFYERISTHTARRTFITLMKRQGKSDKLIASITGHNDMKTLNSYYQISEPEKKEAMDEVFSLDVPLKVAK